MSELQELDVILLPNGDVRIEVRGVKGAKCLEVTKKMEQLLGGKVIERQTTPEYDEHAGQSQGDQQQIRN